MTGLPISHYMEIDFNGFKDLVDAIGGVWVDVPHADQRQQGGQPRLARQGHQKGYQKLDGAHALTFVRSRNFADDDFTRIKDQQIFLKALAKQTFDRGQRREAPEDRRRGRRQRDDRPVRRRRC